VQGAAPPGQVRELRVLEHKFRIENPDATRIRGSGCAALRSAFRGEE
jgi:hypothetical protein